MPLVSIAMATYNEPKAIITKSIISILNQDYKNIELLVADDSTHPETIDAINTLARQDSRIKIIRGEQRMGFVQALNQTLKLAKGQLIARMDGDDMAMSDRISKQVAYASLHPDIAVFGGSMNIIDENDQVISERYYPITPMKIKLMFMFRSPFAHPTVMFRREIIDQGFFYDPTYKKAEDIDFFMRLYKYGYKFGNLHDKLLNYRVPHDFQHKRSRDQWRYNHKARMKFIPSQPLFSILSFFISWGYMYIPESIVSKYYSKENKA